MFKKVTIGIIATSVVGTMAWVGYPYIKASYEVFKREEASEPEEPDTEWDDIYEGLEDLKRLLKEF